MEMPPRRPAVSTPIRPDFTSSRQASSLLTPVRRRAWPVIVILAVLLAVSVGAAGYFFYQYKHAIKGDDTAEIAALTKEIGASLLLPTGETPTLATVTDKEKLASQPFFQKAENGDKVLIYSVSGRAILYRPSVKKVIDMTSVNVNTADQSQPPSAPAPAPDVRKAP